MPFVRIIHFAGSFFPTGFLMLAPLSLVSFSSLVLLSPTTLTARPLIIAFIICSWPPAVTFSYTNSVFELDLSLAGLLVDRRTYSARAS
jgi:hypothetical protein